MSKYSFQLHVDYYPYIIIIRILYIFIPHGGKHLAMNSKLNQAYLWPSASGLTLITRELVRPWKKP